MKPAMFHEMTHVLGAPEGWDAEAKGECLGLPVAADYDPWTMTSCWVLEPEEVALIARGGRVYLTINGFRHPVVALTVRAKE